jgi:hypothetical protein
MQDEEVVKGARPSHSKSQIRACPFPDRSNMVGLSRKHTCNHYVVSLIKLATIFIVGSGSCLAISAILNNFLTPTINSGLPPSPNLASRSIWTARCFSFEPENSETSSRTWTTDSIDVMGLTDISVSNAEMTSMSVRMFL